MQVQVSNGADILFRSGYWKWKRVRKIAHINKWAFRFRLKPQSLYLWYLQSETRSDKHCLYKWQTHFLFQLKVHLKSPGWLLEMVVDSRVWYFYVCFLFNCLSVPRLAAVFLIYWGYINAVTLFADSVKSVEVFLSCWGLDVLIICGWFRDSLYKKLSLNAWGNSWLDGSGLHTWPCDQLCCWLDLFFFGLTVIVLLSICSQVNGLPAAFTHCEHRLQAHTVASVWLRGQRAGI